MPDPWFKFYSTEFLLDARVNLLTLQEQAIVVRMWCIVHQNGSIPDDPKQVAKLIGVNLKTLRSCWDHARMMFVLCGHHEPIIGGSCAHDEVMMTASLTSARLDQERINSESRSNKFRQGANKTNHLRYGKPINGSSPSVSPSVSPSDRPKEEDKEEDKEREVLPLSPPQAEGKPIRSPSWKSSLPECVVECTARIMGFWPDPKKGDIQPDAKNITPVPASSGPELARRLAAIHHQGADLAICEAIASRAVQEWRGGAWIKAAQNFFGKAKDAPFQAYYQAHVTNQTSEPALLGVE